MMIHYGRWWRLNDILLILITKWWLLLLNRWWIDWRVFPLLLILAKKIHKRRKEVINISWKEIYWALALFFFLFLALSYNEA